MGNEKSSIQEMKIEETIEECENWTQESATLTNGSSKVCIFKQSLSDKSKADKLQNLSHNLKLFRHPNILRFISTWRSNGMLFVATEDVKPLSQLLDDLMPMQLCIGLRSILNAVNFLRQVASKSHNNLTIDSIYVNNEGYWKLSGLESMTSLQASCMNNDVEGFSTLALDILNDVNSDDIPGILEFINYCGTSASDEDFFQQLSSHQFFNHEFINIYTFLTELPIKLEEEKSLFFKTLAENLEEFPEKLVARQLGALLLSRLVLLNETAQSHLLPNIFIAKTDHHKSLFTQNTLNEYLRPKLLNMFGLRDSQIRLILLRYFPSLCSLFTKQQLELKILPELLAGVKDTNEQLVTATLHSLADLVPILGAAVVVGQHRTKLFADGRPLMNVTKVEEGLVESNLENPPVSSFVLTERQSPDGGEDFKLPSNVVNEKDEEIVIESDSVESEPIAINPDEQNSSKLNLLNQRKPVLSTYVHDDDLCSLDVKCSKTKKDIPFDDIDLIFKGMEPVILQPVIMKINEFSSKMQKNKFEAVDVDLSGVDGGWEDDVSDIIDGTEE